MTPIFATFPTLQTRRLILRQVRLSDAASVFAFRSDPDVQKYNTEPFTHVSDAESLIDWMLNSYRESSVARWGITLKDEDTVIGLCGFNFWERGNFSASVGYDLARDYWGRGIMTEAVRAVVKFGFDEMALNRLEADTHSENIASIRVLEKLGFQQEGHLREKYFEDGQFHDELLFSLLRREYEAQAGT